MILLQLLACASEHWREGGTGVGNPGTTRLTMARGSEPVVTSASTELAAWEVTRCDGTVQRLTVDAPVDLLDPEGSRLEAGRWCALAAELSGPLTVLGVAEEGKAEAGTFLLELDLPAVSLDLPDLSVDGHSLFLELGSPPKDLLGELEDDTHTAIGPDDPEAAEVAAYLSAHTALFVDRDGDGALSDDERAAGPAVGEDDDDDEDEDDRRSR